MNTEKWDRRYLELARFVSHWSKDPNKQVGAVITERNYVRGIGYNGFPRGVADLLYRLADKQLKNLLMVHAEVNALYLAHGHGDTIYVYPCLPCTQCLGNLAQSNIRRIVTCPFDFDSSWNQPLVLEMASEVGITVTTINLED